MRQTQAEATYERLFGPRDPGAAEDDPELMEILRRFIFGDVFDTGVLDDRAHELIIVTVLACLQTLPQLKAHAAARPPGRRAAGTDPGGLYQLAPFIGFPRHTRCRRCRQRGVGRPRHRAVGRRRWSSPRSRAR